MDSITKTQTIQKDTVQKNQPSHIDTMDIIGEIMGPSVMDISDR